MAFNIGIVIHQYENQDFLKYFVKHSGIWYKLVLKYLNTWENVFTYTLGNHVGK